MRTKGTDVIHMAQETMTLYSVAARFDCSNASKRLIHVRLTPKDGWISCLRKLKCDRAFTRVCKRVSHGIHEETWTCSAAFGDDANHLKVASRNLAGSACMHRLGMWTGFTYQITSFFSTQQPLRLHTFHGLSDPTVTLLSFIGVSRLAAYHIVYLSFTGHRAVALLHSGSIHLQRCIHMPRERDTAPLHFALLAT